MFFVSTHVFLILLFIANSQALQRHRENNQIFDGIQLEIKCGQKSEKQHDKTFDKPSTHCNCTDNFQMKFMTLFSSCFSIMTFTVSLKVKLRRWAPKNTTHYLASHKQATFCFCFFYCIFIMTFFTHFSFFLTSILLFMNFPLFRTFECLIFFVLFFIWPTTTDFLSVYHNCNYICQNAHIEKIFASLTMCVIIQLFGQWIFCCSKHRRLLRMTNH